MALSSLSALRFTIKEIRWEGRLFGGVAAPVDLVPTPLDIVFLRDEPGIEAANVESPASLAAAATAATLAAVADILFRRVTR